MRKISWHKKGTVLKKYHEECGWEVMSWYINGVVLKECHEILKRKVSHGTRKKKEEILYHEKNKKTGVHGTE